jgi:hypothetical protein
VHLQNNRNATFSFSLLHSSHRPKYVTTSNESYLQLTLCKTCHRNKTFRPFSPLEALYSGGARVDFSVFSPLSSSAAETLWTAIHLFWFPALFFPVLQMRLPLVKEKSRCQDQKRSNDFVTLQVISGSGGQGTRCQGFFVRIWYNVSDNLKSNRLKWNTSRSTVHCGCNAITQQIMM